MRATVSRVRIPSSPPEEERSDFYVWPFLFYEETIEVRMYVHSADTILRDVIKTLWNKIWRDKHGRVAIWQTPNPLLSVWILATAVDTFLLTGEPQSFVKFIALNALIIWGVLEVSFGVNYFRRGLGLIVLLVSLANISY